MDTSFLNRKRIAVTIGIILLVLLVIMLGPRPMPVDIGMTSKGPLQIMVESEGRTRIKNIYIVSAPVAGRLLRISLKAGDTVKAGETVLALIEPPQPDFLDARTIAERKAKVSSSIALSELAKADVERAKAALDYARAELSRNETLIAKHFLAPQVLEKFQLEVRTKEAELAVAEKNWKHRQSELEMSRASLLPTNPMNQDSGIRDVVKVVAQTSGKVLRVLQESEVLIRVGTPILEIGDPTDLEVLLEMLSENAAKVRVGAEAIFSGWGGKPLRGRVRRVEPYGFIKISALGIEEQRVNVLVDLLGPIEDWQVMEHGYRVDAQIVIWERNDVLKVPMGALFRDSNEWAVFQVTPQNTAELRHIKIGQSNNSEAEVIEGLSEGSKVILHPSDRIRSGALVISAGGQGNPASPSR